MKNQLGFYCAESTWPKVINFHSVLPYVNQADTFHSWNCSVRDAIGYLDYIRLNFQIISEDDFIEIRKGNENGEGKFLITFDDGYASLHEHLRNYIKSNQLRPIVFLIAGVYSDNLVPWYILLTKILRYSPTRVMEFEGRTYNLDIATERFSLYHLIERGDFNKSDSKEQAVQQLYDRYYSSVGNQTKLGRDMAFLSKNQVSDLLEDGWTIGSHGYSHCPLTEVVPESLDKEIVLSKRILERIFEQTIHSISYPNGYHNSDVTKLASNHYELGFINHHSWSGSDGSMHLTRIYESRIFDIHKVPNNRMMLAKAVDRYSGANSKVAKLKTLLNAALKVPFSGVLTNNLERQLIIGSLKYYMELRNGVRVKKALLAHPGVFLNNKQALGPRRPSITILCGPHAPERAAVASLARLFKVNGVIIHNYAKKPIRVFKGESESYSSKSLFPHVHFDSKPQKKYLGHDSLAWFVTPETEVYSTSDINDNSVLQKVETLKSDLVFVFGTGIIKSDLLNISPPVLNLHWGHSPTYRGSFTLRWPIVNGEHELIGITIHKLSAKLDGGGIVRQQQVVLDGSESIEDIEYKASIQGIELMIKIINEYREFGFIDSVDQDLGTGKVYKSKEYTDSIDSKVRKLLKGGFVYSSRES